MAAPALRRRLASLLYESLVVVALMLVVVALFSFVTLAMPGLAHQRPLLLAMCFASLGGYFTYCWHNGQTLAMRAWKLRIEDAGGRAPGWGRACVRFVLGWVWVAPPLALLSAFHLEAPSLPAAIGYTAAAVVAWMLLWAAASLLRPDRQFWHDVASGTRLVAA